MDRNILVNTFFRNFLVALRKESVDRNKHPEPSEKAQSLVALRKESVDRNTNCTSIGRPKRVALRKESVDRNIPPAKKK